jgi:hypothetical protein
MKGRKSNRGTLKNLKPINKEDGKLQGKKLQNSKEAEASP